MTDSPSINITISSAELKKFCRDFLKRSTDINKAHHTLVTLETFISVFGQSAHGTPEYQEIATTIKTINEQSRQALLEKNTLDLIRALSQCNVIALTAIHTPLSRNGFYQILQTAISQLTDDDIRLIMIWSANWVKEARQLADNASEYPDAPDFIKAGISIEEYQSMSDIDRVLNPQS
ncbi:hypothetical protein MNBD_GAMMA09-2860 [hydrothermal vent metagenome]|uniref:Uncharacterized protein n=1 Tax=hydrothermal vent metagenome TaxID=652676 RepID=A0A3B0YP62_9ZZZZ